MTFQVVRVDLDGFPEDAYFEEVTARYLDENYKIPGGVYFVQGVDGGAIKIGWSKNHPDVRMSDLQIGSPVPLRLLGWIRGSTIRLENHLHDEFAATRLHGEWFEPTEDLLALIDEWTWGEEEVPQK